MAAPNYDEVPVPAGCLDSATINVWLQNLNALADSFAAETTGITCRPIVGAGVDGCIDLPYAGSSLDSTSSDSGAVDKKVFIGPVIVNVGLFAGYIPQRDSGQTPIRDGTIDGFISIECDGQTVATGPTVQFPAGQQTVYEMDVIAECPRRSDLRVCFNTLNAQPDLPPYQADIRDLEPPGVQPNFCGAVLCILEPYSRPLSDIAGFCCAPDIGECKVGRAGIHLLQQNLRALYQFASEGRYITECLTTADAGGVIATLPYDSEYLVLGSATVCAAPILQNLNYTYEGLALNASMFVECGGYETRCPTRQAVLGPSGAACLNVSMAACGVCQAGEIITAGFSNFTDCVSTIGVDVVGGNNIGVTVSDEQYTVFTFRKSDPYEDGSLTRFVSEPVGKCIDRTSVENLITQADAANDYVCTILDNPGYCERVSGTGSTFEVRPALPVPPAPVPLPVPWPPEKKTNMFGALNICVRNTKSAQPNTVNITVEILCGGVVLRTITDACYIPAPMETVYIGQDEYETVTNNPNCCKNIDIDYVATCTVDQPVEIVTTITSPDGPGTFDVISESYNLLALCF